MMTLKFAILNSDDVTWHIWLHFDYCLVLPRNSINKLTHLNAYFQCISSRALMLFKTIDLMPLIKEKNSSVIIP